MLKPTVSLNSLRGFEAAARLASFADAAKELHLSHSAVSHQMKQLESELGQPLFRRVGRSVVLTDAGKDFARTVRDILVRLEDGIARLAPYQKPGGVILYTTQAFARGFILPRMARFRRELPDIDLWLDSSERKIDFDVDEVDILITPADGIATAGLVDAYLLADTRMALAAPRLIERMENTPVYQWPLIHDEGQPTWRDWLALARFPLHHAIDGPNFSDQALMLDAVAAGHGAGIANLICAAPLIESGSLVALPGPTFPQQDYRIYSDQRSLDDDRVRRVYEWFVLAAVK